MRGKYKTQRGRPRRFTSSNDPDAYVRTPTHRRRDQTDEESEEEVGEEANNTKVKESRDDDKEQSTSSSDPESESGTSSTEDNNHNESMTTINRQMNKLKVNPDPSNNSTAPRELTRREREAIERERARQHYLKMKEKEDAARLAIIRKRREEEAALHAAEQKGTRSTN